MQASLLFHFVTVGFFIFVGQPNELSFFCEVAVKHLCELCGDLLLIWYYLRLAYRPNYH